MHRNCSAVSGVRQRLRGSSNRSRYSAVVIKDNLHPDLSKCQPASRLSRSWKECPICRANSLGVRDQDQGDLLLAVEFDEQARQFVRDARSREPVGSSASSRRGWLIKARTTAVRWRSPPESWPGRWSSAAQADAFEQPAGAFRGGGAERVIAAGQGGHEDVFQDGALGQQMMGLKMNPIWRLRTPANSPIRPVLPGLVPAKGPGPRVGWSRVPNSMLRRCSCAEPRGPRWRPTRPVAVSRLIPSRTDTGGPIQNRFYMSWPRRAVAKRLPRLWPKVDGRA